MVQLLIILIIGALYTEYLKWAIESKSGGPLMKDWMELTRIIGDEPFVIEKVGMPGKEISIEGKFDPPPLAKLPMEDQVFIAAFVRSHGSIKQMEQLFGISYPTVKNRLNRIGDKLSFVEITRAEGSAEILERLESGDLSVEEALKRLNK
jgi:hypothetical protein